MAEIRNNIIEHTNQTKINSVPSRMINIFIIAYDNKNVVVRQEEQFFPSLTSRHHASRPQEYHPVPRHPTMTSTFIYYLFITCISLVSKMPAEPVWAVPFLCCGLPVEVSSSVWQAVRISAWAQLCSRSTGRMVRTDRLGPYQSPWLSDATVPRVHADEVRPGPEKRRRQCQCSPHRAFSRPCPYPEYRNGGVQNVPQMKVSYSYPSAQAGKIS